MNKKTLITLIIISTVLAGTSAITTYKNIIDNNCDKSNELLIRPITEMELKHYNQLNNNIKYSKENKGDK